MDHPMRLGVPVPSPFVGMDEEGTSRNVVDALLRVARDLENLVNLIALRG